MRKLPYIAFGEICNLSKSGERNSGFKKQKA
jgi:hypothetical protein